MTQMKDIGVLARVYLCVCLSVCVCAHNLGNLCRRKSCDEVVSLRWSHSSTSMSLAVQLTLHKEIALLFEVDVTVGAHKASRVTIFVSSFHHCPNNPIPTLVADGQFLQVSCGRSWFGCRGFYCPGHNGTSAITVNKLLQGFE